MRMVKESEGASVTWVALLTSRPVAGSIKASTSAWQTTTPAATSAVARMIDAKPWPTEVRNFLTDYCPFACSSAMVIPASKTSWVSVAPEMISTWERSPLSTRSWA